MLLHRVEPAGLEADAALDAPALIDHVTGAALAGDAVDRAVVETEAAADALVGDFEMDQLGADARRTAGFTDMCEVFLLEIRQRLANAAENVRQGNSIHLSLEQTAIFPPMMLYMVASGEKSGQLGTLMVRAADNQETLQQNRIALTLSIFEPALIITMALIVLFIVVSVLQPLLQLNSMIN